MLRVQQRLAKLTWPASPACQRGGTPAASQKQTQARPRLEAACQWISVWQRLRQSWRHAPLKSTRRSLHRHGAATRPPAHPPTHLDDDDGRRRRRTDDDGRRRTTTICRHFEGQRSLLCLDKNRLCSHVGRKDCFHFQLNTFTKNRLECVAHNRAQKCKTCKTKSNM